MPRNKVSDAKKSWLWPNYKQKRSLHNTTISFSSNPTYLYTQYVPRRTAHVYPGRYHVLTRRIFPTGQAFTIVNKLFMRFRLFRLFRLISFQLDTAPRIREIQWRNFSSYCTCPSTGDSATATFHAHTWTLGAICPTARACR